MVIFHSYVKLPEGTGSQNIETSARRCPLWDIQREHFATGTGKKTMVYSDQSKTVQEAWDEI